MWSLFYRLLGKVITFNEKILIYNPSFLIFFLKITPPALLHILSELRMLQVYYQAKNEVPAYKNFLKENKVTDTIKNFNDFTRIAPIQTKENYIYKYSITDRCREGNFPYGGNIDESAGSSGKATMWVRSTKEEELLQRLINFAMHYTFKAFSKNNIIVLNCWSTGPWATGIKFSMLAQRSTVVKSIGTDKRNAVDTITTLGDKFEYVIGGYPPFVKEILDYGEEIGVDWKKYKLNIVTGGEGFSEGWRNYIKDRINGSYGEVFSAYGASDIDIGIGFETNFTIKLRQLADKDKEFSELLFGKYTPTFVGVYNPLVYLIEQKGEELLFSTANPDIWAPKIRYNLKDAGKIYKFQDLKKIIQSSKFRNKINFDDVLKLPIIIIYGRSDGTVSLDGANIYPYDIQDAIYRSKHAKYFDSFFLETDYTSDKSMIFKVSIELTEGKHKNDFNQLDYEEIQTTIRETLLKKNKDYRESWQNNPDSLEPRIVLLNKSEGIFLQNSSKLKKVYMIKK